MYLIFQGRVAKNIEESHLCEDQYAYYPVKENNKRIAVVSDGATESYASRDWAEILVSEFVQTFANTNQSVKMADVLQKACSQYQQRFAAQEKTWAQERSYLRGSFATLLAAIEHKQTIDLYCIGDSLAVIIDCDDNGQIIDTRTIPYTKASEFATPPLPFASEWAMNEQLLQQNEFFTPNYSFRQPETGYSVILLMTDALGAWLLVEDENTTQQKELRQKRLNRLLALRDAKELEELVLSERKNTEHKLKFDDVTLLILSNKELGITPVEILAEDGYPELITTPPKVQETTETRQPEKTAEPKQNTAPKNLMPQKSQQSALYEHSTTASNQDIDERSTQQTYQQKETHYHNQPNHSDDMPKRTISPVLIAMFAVVLLLGIGIGLVLGLKKGDMPTVEQSKKEQKPITQENKSQEQKCHWLRFGFGCEKSKQNTDSDFKQKINEAKQEVTKKIEDTKEGIDNIKENAKDTIDNKMKPHIDKQEEENNAPTNDQPSTVLNVACLGNALPNCGYGYAYCCQDNNGTFYDKRKKLCEKWCEACKNNNNSLTGI